MVRMIKSFRGPGWVCCKLESTPLLVRLLLLLTEHNVNITIDYEVCKVSFVLQPFSISAVSSSVMIPPTYIFFHTAAERSIMKANPIVKNIPFCRDCDVPSCSYYLPMTVVWTECSAAVRAESRKCVYVTVKVEQSAEPIGIQDCCLLRDRIIALYGLLRREGSELISTHVAATWKETVQKQCIINYMTISDVGI